MSVLRFEEAENLADVALKAKDEARASERGLAAVAHGIDLCQLDASSKVNQVVPVQPVEEELTDEELAQKASRAALNGF